MAQLWLLRVAGGGGEGARAAICAFSGLYLGGGGGAGGSSRCFCKGHPLFQLTFPSREGREQGSLIYLLENAWRCSLFKFCSWILFLGAFPVSVIGITPLSPRLLAKGSMQALLYLFPLNIKLCAPDW